MSPIDLETFRDARFKGLSSDYKMFQIVGAENIKAFFLLSVLTS